MWQLIHVNNYVGNWTLKDKACNYGVWPHIVYAIARAYEETLFIQLISKQPYYLLMKIEKELLVTKQKQKQRE